MSRVGAGAVFAPSPSAKHLALDSHAWQMLSWQVRGCDKSTGISVKVETRFLIFGEVETSDGF
jgi:hypothetical protein